MSSPAITCSALSRSFPSGVALDRLDLEVPAGTVLALLGPNGAGKTTTIRLLNGVLRPDSGHCSVLGLDPVADGTELRRRTGVLTENAGLDDRLTARENLEVVGRLRGMRSADLRARSADLLERFGMGRFADVRCVGFSTGQRRRMALARALMSDPELLFLDEPTSGLDPAATTDVLDLIDALVRNRGRTVVLCTHFLAEAGRLADRMAILHRGRLITHGEPAALAAQIWPGVEVHLDLGRPADQWLTSAVANMSSVQSASPSSSGLRVVVERRDTVPAVAATVVAAGWPLFAATPVERSLEDVYFAYQATLDSDTSGLTNLAEGVLR